MEFITFGILFKTIIMKLRILLIAFCLLGIGIFSKAQTKQAAKPSAKPTIENGADAIPVVVSSTRKKKAAPKVEVTKFTPPVIVKDGDKKAPPPPPPTKTPPPPPPAPRKNN
jgi:hypothetical protein